MSLEIEDKDLEAIRAIGSAERDKFLEKKNISNEESQPDTENDTTSGIEDAPTIIDGYEDAAIFIEDEIDEEELDTEDDNTSTPPTLEDMVKAFDKVPNADARMELASALHKDIDDYQKELIIKSGFTPEEASKASWNRMKNLSVERTTKYLEDNPNLGVLTINKSQENELNLSDEEKAKLSRSSALHLIVVEDEEISSLIGNAIPSKEKASFLDEVLGALSKYGLPMPVYGDFLTFRGAKTVQLASIISSEDMSVTESINMQASLVYDRLLGGTLMKKKDENDSVIMSYEQFINNFPYYDLDMAIYAVLCASTEEEFDIPLVCPNCGTTNNTPSAVKTLLDMNDESVTEHFKSRINSILGSRNDPEKMATIRDTWNKALYIKSTSGKYIYTLQCPSIAKMMRVYQYTQSSENYSELVYGTIIAWVRELYVLDVESGRYIKVTDDPSELDTLSTLIAELPEKEFNVLVQLISDKVYAPTFRTKMRCKKCGREYPATLDISQLVFHRVRATQEVTM